MVDTAGYSYAIIVVQLGATDIALTNLRLQESDVSGSGYADIPGTVYGTGTGIDGATSALPTATDDNKAFAFGVNLLGRKRYLDLIATVGDGTTGAFVTAFALLFTPGTSPNTAAEYGFENLIRV